MDYKQVSKQIIEIVGGKENVTNVYHCMTRLRMTLVDTSKVDEEKLNVLKEAKGFVYNGSTIQIIIGPSIVDDLTEVVQADLNMGEEKLENDEKRSAITIIQSIVMPSVPVLAGASLFSALYSILSILGVDTELGFMVLMTTIATTMTGGLGVFFGFNASKTFGGTPYMGAFFAILLTYGAIDGVSVFGFTLAQGMGGILSIVAIAIFSAFAERFFKSKIPEVLRYVFVPFCTLVVSVIALIFIIAPITNLINSGLTTFITYAINSSPLVYAIACALLASVWLLVIMSGMHIAVVMIMYPIAIETGILPIEPALAMAMPALLGVATGVFLLKRKESVNVKQIGATSLPLIILGISEPALYGLILPNPRLFVNVGLAAGVASLVNILLGTEVTFPNAMGAFEIFTSTQPATFALSYAIAFGIGCGLTVILNKSNLKYN